MRTITLFLMTLVATATIVSAADELTSEAFTVVDGVTIDLGDRQLSLNGIAVPELGRMCLLSGRERDCGLIARAALLDLTAGATIVCSASDADTHRCTANGYDLSEGMIYTGWAVPLPGAPEVYRTVLADARGRPRGFWRGEFVAPWPQLTAAIAEE